MADTTQNADATKTGASEVAKTGILDLNDPSVHYGRDQAMTAMRARRREKVVEDMEPAEAAAFLAGAGAIATSTSTTSEDDDPEAQRAEEERARLEREAAAAEARGETTQTTEARGTDTSQIERQTTLPAVLAGDDIANVKVRIKVLGEERDVPLSEIVAAAQKTESADQYLAKAKTLLGDIDARLAALPKAGETAKTTTGEAQPATTEALETAVGEALNLMFRGKEDEATKALSAAITKAAQPATQEPINRDDLARSIASEIAKSSALRRFAKDHPEIMSDRIRRYAADEFLNRELKELGVTTLEQLPADQIAEVVETAGNKVRDYFGLKKATTTTARSGASGTEATTLSDKRDRKKTIDELPSASTRAAITEPVPKSTSDKIADMARARGQLREPAAP
jgi:hypothetical protein